MAARPLRVGIVGLDPSFDEAAALHRVLTAIEQAAAERRAIDLGR